MRIVKMCILLTILCTIVVVLPITADDITYNKRVAILEVTNNTDGKVDPEYSAIVSNSLQAKFVNSSQNNYSILLRNKLELERIFKELKLPEEDNRFSDISLNKIGEFLTADYLILSQIIKGGDDIYIKATLYAVESSEIINMRFVKMGTLNDFYQKLTVSLDTVVKDFLKPINKVGKESIGDIY